MRKSLSIAFGCCLILWLASVTTISAEESQTRVILGTIQSVEQDPSTGEFVINLTSGSSFPVSTESRIYEFLPTWPVPYRGRITLSMNEEELPVVIDIEHEGG